jgi:fatty-acyl-CoA synthase
VGAQFHLADLFEIVAGATPDRIAILTDDAHLTYAALNDRAERVASGLAAQGLRRGDRVGLYLLNGPEHVECFIAAVKLGAVPFNVNYRYRAEELRALFRDAQANAVIYGAEFEPVMREVRGDVPAIAFTVAVPSASGAVDDRSINYAELIGAEPGGPYERSEGDILLQYTGGTTGTPKGVMWPHKAFVFACAGGGGYFHPKGPIAAVEDIAERAREGPELRIYPTAPLMHAAAVWTVWAALLGGLTIVLDRAQRFDPEDVWSRVERHGVNLLQFVGDAMAIPLRDALRAHAGRWNLAGLFSLGSGGAPFSKSVKAELRELVPGAVITDGMGSSETGISGMAEVSDIGGLRLASSDVQRVVVGDRFARPGETGLIARSGYVPIGYYGDPAKSAEVFRRIEGRVWAVSGDAGQLETDGAITMFGRGSTCINTGGEKVYPEEVESTLQSHPAILDAVVVGAKDARWGERIVAIASSRVGVSRPSLDELKSFVSERLAAYKVPKALVWVDSVRRSPAGKQDYRWAREVAGSA